ncbi:MBL fold metallo-hydrolase [Nocardia thailandica]
MGESGAADRAERTPGTAAVLLTCAALAATPLDWVRPRRPEPAWLEVPLAPLPPARATVTLTRLEQAAYGGPAAFVTAGSPGFGTTRLTMSGFLVEHPDGRFLVDPALCAGVVERVLPELPFPLPSLLAPGGPVRALTDVLAAHGLGGAEIDFVLPTHLHWDHVAGLYELPGWIPIRVTEAEYHWAMGGSHAPLGVARGPLRGREFHRYELTGPPVLTFARSHDLFGDGAVLLVDLAGHTPGSVGVLLALADGSRVLLAGDAVWSTRQLELIREKAPLPGLLLDADRDTAFATVHRLAALPDDIVVLPAHDHAAVAAY